MVHTQLGDLISVFYILKEGYEVKLSDNVWFSIILAVLSEKINENFLIFMSLEVYGFYGLRYFVVL